MSLYRAEVIETRQVSVIYFVDAQSVSEARGKMLAHEVERTEGMKTVRVLKRLVVEEPQPVPQSRLFVMTMRDPEGNECAVTTPANSAKDASQIALGMVKTGWRLVMIEEG